MAEVDVYILSEQALADVIDQVRPDQWGQRKPEWFHTGGQGDATLREIVNYHTYDTAWVPDVLAGRTAARSATGTSTSRRRHRRSTAPYSERAVAAAEALDDPERTVHLSYGEFPAREYLRHITSFRGFRVYDIARWIGASTAMPPALVEGMWEVLSPDMEAWRALGVYKAAVPVPDGAPLQDRLLGLAGRDPHPAGA